MGGDGNGRMEDLNLAELDIFGCLHMSFAEIQLPDRQQATDTIFLL